MNRDQIKKALECCAEAIFCARCPAVGFCDGTEDLHKNALAIIRDLDAEKEMAKADTLRDIETKFAIHFGTYTNDATIKVSDVFKLLSEFKEEIMEG